jgi:hypothetical protein
MEAHPITHTVTAAEAAAPATPISVLLPATDITAAGQGPATITTTYADAAGNAAAPVTTAVDIDTMPPAAPTVSVPEAAGGINATEAADGVPVLVTLPAGAVAGDVITVSIDGSTPITHTVTAAEAAAPATPISVLLPAADITAAGQGPATITTTYADAAGNAAAPVTTAVDIDTMPPAAPTVSVPEAAGGINATEAADGVPVLVTLPAGAVAGDVITVSIDGSTPITHTVTAAEAAAPATPISVLLPAADITAAGQGPATITTTYADAAGNAAAPVTTAVDIDTVAPPAAPTVSVPEAAGGINATEAADGVPVLVTLPAGAVAGDVITVSIDGSTPVSYTVTAADVAAPATPISVLLPAADITAAGQGPATITTTYADAAGNAAAPVTTAVDIDTMPPAAPTVSVPEATGGINATEAADGVPVLVTLPAGAVAGDVITVSIDGSTPITHTVTAAEAAAPATPISVLLPATDITAAGQGPATITTTYADAAGNAAAPVTTAVDIDTVAPPAAPTVSVPEAAGGINATEAADGVPVLVTLPAGAVAGDVITVSIDGSTPITHTVTAAEAAAPATPISVLLPAADITAAGQGPATITTTYADAAGNAAAPVTTAVDIDTVAPPAAPTVSVPEAAGGINATEAADGVPVLVTLPAGAVAGDVITVSIDGSTPITHTVTAAEAAAPATPISVLLPATDITAAGQGPATITTTYADAAGNAAAPVTTAVDIDTVAPPAAPTVSVPEAAGGINATEAADGVPVLVTLPAGAVAGDVITVSIDGSTPITHTVTAAEAAAPATPISVLLPAADITAAGQGPATITTTYADAAGNAAAPVTTAVDIDTMPPAAPTVSVPEATGGINATEAADGVPVLVTLPAGAVAGDVITVSIDGSTPITHTVTAAEAAAPATPISVLLPAADITAAGQGPATITTTYADAAGNAAAPVTTAVDIDTMPPAAPTVSVPEAAGGINATEAADGVPVLVTLPAGAVAGDVITVSIDGSTPITHTVTAAEAAAPATPISVLLPATDITAAGQGPATITTTYADAAGNAAAPVTTAVDIDTVAPPAAPTVSVPEAAGGINATEAADGVPVLVTLPAGAVAGDVITVSIDGSTPITHTVTAAEAAAPATPISVLLPATDITAAGQGPATITTTYADAAGNAAAPVTTAVDIDTMPPAAPTVSVPEAAGGINATEAADGVPVLVTLPAGAVAGDVITVSIDGSTPITHTVTAAEAAAPATPISVLLPATDITAAGQGPATITTTYADAAGNAAAPVTTAVDIDTVAPPAAPTVSVPEAAGGINATEAADGVPVLVTLPAGAVAGDVITVSIDGSTPITHTVTAAEAAAPATPISVLLPAADITAAGQGPATITTTYADAAGNAAAPVTTAVDIDTMPPAAPTVSVPEAAGGINATEAADGVPVLVTLPAGAVAGDVITVSIDGSTPITHTVTAAEAAAPATPISVLLPAADITAAGQGPATITTTYADAAGNAAAPVTTAVDIDTVAPPAAPTVSVPEAAGGINATEAADGVPVLVTLPAGAVAGDVITVSIDGSTPITHTVTAAEAAAPATPISVLLPATDITAAGQGPATITTTYADAAGNAAAPVTTAVDIDTMPPAAPTVSVPEAAGGINATEAADGVPVLVTLPAGAVAGDVITVSIDGSTPITHTVTAAEAAAPATPISVLLPATDITAAGQGPATITTTYADAAGNAAAPVTTAVDIDTVAPPAAPTVSVPEAAGGINATEAADGVPVLVTLPAGAVAGDVITVSIDGSTPITHTVTAAEAAAPATPISVLLPAADITAAGQGPATITTTYADAAGNAAAPVTTAVDIDTVAPPAAPTVSVPEAAGGINATEAADGVPVLVTLPAGAVAGDVITVSIDGSTPITHTVTAAEAAAPATPISVLLPATDITAAGQGPATITTTYADAAGNAAAPVTTAVDIDTVAPPAAPTPYMSYADNVGALQTIPGAWTDATGNYYRSGSTTDDTTPGMAGTLSSALQTGEVVHVYDGGTYLGDATATVGSTTWSYTPATALSAGTHNFTYKVEDLAGNLGTASSTYSITVEPPVTTSADGTASGTNALTSYVDQVTGTDIVSAAEKAAGFHITGKVAGGTSANLSFYMDTDRTNGVDNAGQVLLADGVNGVHIAVAGDGSYDITFDANSAALGAATVHNTYGNGVKEFSAYKSGVEAAHRLFLVADGTASASDSGTVAQNYSVQDKITRNVFVYYFGDPDGNGVGLWTKQDTGDTATNIGINTSDRDFDSNSWGDWDYYNTTGVALGTPSTSANTALGMVTNVAAKVWEFAAANPNSTTTYTYDQMASLVGNHTTMGSNSSRTMTFEEGLALYAANFGGSSGGGAAGGAASTVGAVQAMTDTSSYNGYTTNEDNRPGGWSRDIWTGAPSPSGHVHVSLNLGHLHDCPNANGNYAAAVL